MGRFMWRGLAAVAVLAASSGIGGCFRPHAPAPRPLPTPTDTLLVRPSSAVPLPDVPACGVFRPDLAAYVVNGTSDDQPPSRSGTQVDQSCSLKGRLSFAGGPIGEVYVRYGRDAPVAGMSADARAASAAGDHLRGTCQGQPTQIDGSYHYAQSCGASGPQVYEEAGIANSGAFINVLVKVADNGGAQPDHLRQEVAGAVRSLATRLFARL